MGVYSTAGIIRFIEKEELNDLLALYNHLNSDDGDLIVDTWVRALWDGILAVLGDRIDCNVGIEFVRRFLEPASDDVFLVVW